eukprot:TRINITY_DN6779_c0_g1_i1.p1 TRINITY_DN6779_c0_g1~~TRINITY_DN6779_c0_g1_i1.p1  ORF type:complete len:350 (+),score=86.99 TRINITY_DN6779_c0_g1_i1:92-1141(+)
MADADDCLFDFLKEDQIEEWLDHLDEVFEATPRSYFAGHFVHDVTPDLEGIRVAIDKRTGRIVATVRVFIRKMFWDGAVVPVGGIGEVSTKAAWRGKGLASTLLNQALHYMKSRGLHCSSLHTSKAAPVYAKLGWRAVPRITIRRPIDDLVRRAAETTGAAAGVFGKVLPLNWTDLPMVDALMPLYSQYASRWNGPLVRASHRYWQQWVPNEPHRALAVGHRSEDGTYELEAYAAFGPKKREEHVLLLSDFCVSDKVYAGDRGFGALLLLLHYFLTDYHGRTLHDAASVRRTYTEFVYPACIFGGAEPFMPEWQQVDAGTMYRADSPAMQLKFDTADPKSHLFWTTDSF